MRDRNPLPPARDRKEEPNQSLTSEFGRTVDHHPAHGALHPAHGTIQAPIVVVGATGTIGGALVRLLVAGGQPVVAVAPSAARLGMLRDAGGPGAVTTMAGRVETETDAARLAEQLRALERPLAGVVVTFPHGRSVAIGVDRGRVLDRPTAELGEYLQQTVLTQHALARRLIPLLAESSRNAHYVIVGGPGSETPWAGYGHRSIATAATRMLARVLHDEARPCGVRVQLLSIDSPVRGDRPGEHECPDWPAASDVACSVARLLDRTSNDESTDVIVACGSGRTACSAGRAARAFTDVPSLLTWLKNPTQKIAPK
jgi:NAD(P)-dependent dehydrogenase (short-subunit alcohol dehydrogenase family)